MNVRRAPDSATLACVIALSLVLVLATAQVPQAPEALAAPSHALRVEAGRDLLITGSAAGLWLTSELLKPQLAPQTCRWCAGPGGSEAINAFDRIGYDHLKWEDTRTAARISDLGAFAVVPLSMLGGGALLALDSGAAADIPENLLIVAQSAAIAGLVNQAVKFLAGRQRPYAHRGTDAELLAHDKADSNLSFYSGHTNVAFVLAASMGTVAELRGYEHSWIIWAVGMPLAAAVGWMRVAADRHYLTDVLVGAVMGTAFGVAIPLLLHPRKEEGTRLSPTGVRMSMSAVPGGLSFSGTF